MAEPTITCPNRKTEIKLTESLAAPLPEARRKTKIAFFDAQDQVDRQREDLIGNIEGKLQKDTDLAAHPNGRKVLKLDQPNRAYELLEGKLLRNDKG